MLATNGSRAGARRPVLRLRQDYGACTLLWVGYHNKRTNAAAAPQDSPPEYVPI